VTTPKGTFGTAGNTERLNPTNNFDATLAKSINLRENGMKLQFSGRFFNVLNHPQYVGGYLSDVAPMGFTSTAVHNFTIPSAAQFHTPSQVFSSNPRGITVAAKFVF
jgi:hypothetical protein